MKKITFVAMTVAMAALTAAALAAEMTSEQRATAKWITEQAKAWADQACGGKWVLSDVLADDFQGTAPKGIRYGKPSGAPPADPNTKWSTDCRLDSADVRFFGADVAVVYGAESKTVALDDAKHERRCLVWTDTWLRRDGKWQIIAVQDNRIDCPPEESAPDSMVSGLREKLRASIGPGYEHVAKIRHPKRRVTSAQLGGEALGPGTVIAVVGTLQNQDVRSILDLVGEHVRETTKVTGDSQFAVVQLGDPAHSACCTGTILFEKRDGAWSNLGAIEQSH